MSNWTRDFYLLYFQHGLSCPIVFCRYSSAKEKLFNIIFGQTPVQFYYASLDSHCRQEPAMGVSLHRLNSRHRNTSFRQRETSDRKKEKHLKFYSYSIYGSDIAKWVTYIKLQSSSLLKSVTEFLHFNPYRNNSLSREDIQYFMAPYLRGCRASFYFLLVTTEGCNRKQQWSE